MLTHENDASGFQLRVPEFSVRPGELVAVVGRVGAGKSSLIQALLGNMHLEGGSCHSGGRIAYVPQVWWCVAHGRAGQGGGQLARPLAMSAPSSRFIACPPARLPACPPALSPARLELPEQPSPATCSLSRHRCQNLTLKENIMFGQPWDQARYERVLHACALELDLEILAAGDQTKVGRRCMRAPGHGTRGPAPSRLQSHHARWGEAADVQLVAPKPPRCAGRPARHQPVWRPAPAPQPCSRRLL